MNKRSGYARAPRHSAPPEVAPSLGRGPPEAARTSRHRGIRAARTTRAAPQGVCTPGCAHSRRTARRCTRAARRGFPRPSSLRVVGAAPI
jgi:hypothetical protein